ncbi:hypothetical protein JXD20_01820 [Candidatus Peregrinibacteria bacterium]|nr:hypothetical protein [Candidatus Peregrinibacteria bacterium]
MKKILLTLFAALLFLPTFVQAATFQAGEEIYIDQSTSDDLYTSGGILSVTEEVSGDLIAAGGKVMLRGRITQDLTALGGNLMIDGEVDDDIRVIGGSIHINAIAKDDLMGVGGDVTLTDNTFVGGDVNLIGGSLVLGGVINGDMRLAGASIYLNADVKGDVTLLSFEKITFGPRARIQGTLTYAAEEPLKMPANLVKGGIIFKEIETSRVKENLPAIMAGFSIFSFLATLFFGLILLWLCRYYILHASEIAYDATLKTVGVGFLALILSPIMVLILLITTVGIPAALALLVLWLVFLYMAKVMAAMLIGFKLVRVTDKSKFIRMFGSFTLGAVIYTLIDMVPVVGWVINLVFVLIALGAMTLYEFELFYQLRKKKIV